MIIAYWATITSNGSPYAMGPLSLLSVMLVYCGQTVGWIKMPLGTGVGLGPGDTVRWRPSSPPQKGAQQPFPHLSAHVSAHVVSAHVYCGQTVARLGNWWAVVDVSTV